MHATYVHARYEVYRFRTAPSFMLQPWRTRAARTDNSEWPLTAMQAFFDAAVCFFIPFFAASPTGADSIIDVFSVGKTIHICMLGVVTMEIMIVTRYWTWWFGIICVLSYALVYPFVLIFPLFQQAIDTWDMAHFGVGTNIMKTPFFWISLVSVYSTTFAVRYLERATKWLFRPDDNMIRAELEVMQRQDGLDSSVFGDSLSTPLSGPLPARATPPRAGLHASSLADVRFPPALDGSLCCCCRSPVGRACLHAGCAAPKPCDTACLPLTFTIARCIHALTNA